MTEFCDVELKKISIVNEDYSFCPFEEYPFIAFLSIHKDTNIMDLRSGEIKFTLKNERFNNLPNWMNLEKKHFLSLSYNDDGSYYFRKYEFSYELFDMKKLEECYISKENFGHYFTRAANINDNFSYNSEKSLCFFDQSIFDLKIIDTNSKIHCYSGGINSYKGRFLICKDNKERLAKIYDIYNIKQVDEIRNIGFKDHIYFGKNIQNLIFIIKNNIKETYLIKYSNSKKYCCVCFSDIKQNYALNPCGHTGICEMCIPKLKSCPICRAEIKSYIKIFL